MIDQRPVVTGYGQFIRRVGTSVTNDFSVFALGIKKSLSNQKIKINLKHLFISSYYSRRTTHLPK